MICVTRAGGTVSSDLIKQLESANAPFRAAHFSNEKAEAARARGIDAVIIDYNRPEMLRAAFQGCDKLFLLGPNALNQSELEQNAVEAAFYSASGEAKISHVDVRDIAAVAVKALTEPTHAGKAYTLTGPEALTYDEFADELSKVLGRPISHISLPPSDLKQGMLAVGMPEEIADQMLDLERYYREDQASRITNDIKQVTGREPRRFADYVQETAATGVWDAGEVTR